MDLEVEPFGIFSIQKLFRGLESSIAYTPVVRPNGIKRNFSVSQT